jgi:hypothetical protein
MGIRSSKKPSKPRKLTDEECDEGIELYRQRYHDGNLTASDIKKLESVPSWFWELLISFATTAETEERSRQCLL